MLACEHPSYVASCWGGLRPSLFVYESVHEQSIVLILRDLQLMTQ